VFGAQGRSITLYNRPAVLREIVTTSDGWAVDDVFAQFEQTFRPVVEGTENMYAPKSGGS
jgi:hypothetical protein